MPVSLSNFSNAGYKRAFDFRIVCYCSKAREIRIDKKPSVGAFLVGHLKRIIQRPIVINAPRATAIRFHPLRVFLFDDF